MASRKPTVKSPSAEFVLSARHAEQFRRDDRPEVAFCGRSNVGKSSLMNRLLGRKGLARTSSTPGRTQAVNYFLIDDRTWFVDLPGYGYAKASKKERGKWAELIGQYFEDASGRPAGGRLMLIQLVDAKVGATKLDVQATDYFVGFGVPLLVVATKIDKVKRSKRHRQLASIRRDLELPEDAPPLPVSAVTGEGIKELWAQIRHLSETANPGTDRKQP